MFARVPASSANLGPGFDALAIALSLHVEVTLEEADSFSISSDGCGAGLHDDERHLGARVAAAILGHRNFSMHVSSSIPLSRGLGSSAALALAAAAAAGSTDPLAVAAEVDGHGENAAASMLGGLVAASAGPGGVVARSLTLDEAWRFVAVIPDQELATADARRVLPLTVPFADAVRNVQSLGLLLAGLADHRVFVAESMEDHLHQPYRSALLSFADPLLARLVEGGALGSCWSGAGSTMLALATASSARAVAESAEDFLRTYGIAGAVHVLESDRRGLVTR